jgi:hypothetical protein
MKQISWGWLGMYLEDVSVSFKLILGTQSVKIWKTSSCLIVGPSGRLCLLLPEI